MKVVGQLGSKIERAEIERAKRKITNNLDAYDYYFRAMKDFYGFARQDSDHALAEYYKAIELDPDFCAAHAWAAIAYTKRRQSNWMIDSEREVQEAVRLARKALELGRDDALALCVCGFTIAFLSCELEEGLALTDQAIALNANLAAAWQASGWIRAYIGEPETAIDHLAQAMRLSPLDPQRAQLWSATGLAMRCAGRFEEAVLWAEKAIRDQPAFIAARVSHAISLALAGRQPDAQKALLHALQLDPSLRVSKLPLLQLLRRPEDRDNLIKGAQLAGMPE
jgi:tetratricopeptide (TPR) repeat protein